MKRQPMVVSSIVALRWKAASALPMTSGARVIDSTPPAITTSSSPARMARAAVPTASMPDAHSRFMVVPGTLAGRPASRAAMRATLRLSSPAWLAQPRITSSTASASSAWRERSALDRNGREVVRAHAARASRRSARWACAPHRRYRLRGSCVASVGFGGARLQVAQDAEFLAPSAVASRRHLAQISAASRIAPAPLRG